MAVFAELLDLVLPNVCVCCGRASPAQWCQACREPADVRRCEWRDSGQALIEVWAAADYAGAARQALPAYKERGQRKLARPLAQLLSAAVRAAAGPGSDRPVLIVPVPSTAAAARERGGDHMLRLALALGRLAPVSPSFEIAPVLRVRGRRSESVGLTGSERAAQDGAFIARRPSGSQSFADVVIVDDIATTGATITACADALRAQGWRVRSAAVVAQTRLRCR